MSVLELQTRVQKFESTSSRYLSLKRAFDLAVCLTMLPFVLPFVLVVAIAITLDSPGGPFFVQPRVGKDGRQFRLYKFRTMRSDHDDRSDRAFMQAFVAGRLNGSSSTEVVAVHKPVKKTSVTRVGRVLRKISLDELPQIFNILKGEMSLIGPRPNVPWEVESYQDWHYERLKVLPGITGLAQVHGRSRLEFEEIVLHDIHYVRNLSAQLDLWILWRTVWTVLTGDGAG